MMTPEYKHRENVTWLCILCVLAAILGLDDVFGIILICFIAYFAIEVINGPEE